MLALAALGLAIAGYLTLVQIGALGSPWDPLFGSASSRSVLDLTAPVPDAVAGVVAYGTELVLLYLRRARVLLGFILLAGGATSVALILIQPTIAGSWCALCLGSAAVSFALLGLGHAEARAALDVLRHPRRAMAAMGGHHTGGPT
jgi:hypothetical protein